MNGLPIRSLADIQGQRVWLRGVYVCMCVCVYYPTGIAVLRPRNKQLTEMDTELKHDRTGDGISPLPCESIPRVRMARPACECEACMGIGYVMGFTGSSSGGRRDQALRDYLGDTARWILFLCVAVSR